MQRLDINCESLKNEENGKVCLYSVVVITPHKGTETHFVLAENEENASDQARCAMKCSTYHLPEELKDKVKTFVTRLPMLIAGWGGNRY